MNCLSWVEARKGWGGISSLIIGDEDLDDATTGFGVLSVCQGLEGLDGVFEGVSVGDEVFDATHFPSSAVALCRVGCGGVGGCLSVQATPLCTKGTTGEETEGDWVGVCVTEDTDDVYLPQGGVSDREGLNRVTHSDKDDFSACLCGKDACLDTAGYTSALKHNIKAFRGEIEGSWLSGVSRRSACSTG